MKFVSKWNQHSMWPITALSLVYLVIYAMTVVFKFDSQSRNTFDALNSAIWVIFAIDLVFRFIGRESLYSYFKKNWMELLALLLPFIRLLRAFRFLLAFRAFKVVSKSRRVTTLFWASILVPFTWAMGALAILDAESTSLVASINSLDKALWWSLTTITTVGYGDLYPTTLEGRFVAGALMLTGIALFSACAGVFASWVLESPNSSKSVN